MEKETNHTPEFIESLKTRLTNEITGSCTYETDLDDCSWQEQHGVLLSCNQGIYLKELIASAPTLKAENEALKRIESQTKGMGQLVLRLQTELSEMKRAKANSLIDTGKSVIMMKEDWELFNADFSEMKKEREELLHGKNQVISMCRDLIEICERHLPMAGAPSDWMTVRGVKDAIKK